MTGTESKTLKLPQFSGVAGDFQLWFMRFMAYATLHKFAQALKDTPDRHLPANEEEDTANETDANRDARKRNLTAMYTFYVGIRYGKFMRDDLQSDD